MAAQPNWAVEQIESECLDEGERAAYPLKAPWCEFRVALANAQSARETVQIRTEYLRTGDEIPGWLLPEEFAGSQEEEKNARRRNHLLHGRDYDDDSDNEDPQ